MIHTFRFTTKSTYDKKFIAIVDEQAKLRKIDINNNYSRDGKYTSSIIETEELFAEGINNFIGIYLVCDEPIGTNIRFNISIDGTNWLYWDGTNWISAGINTNTINELSEGILSLQDEFIIGNEKRLKFKVFLNTNTNQDLTPTILYIYVYTNLTVNFYEDACRSIFKYIKNNFDTNIYTSFNTTTTNNTFTFTPIYNVKEIKNVYNLSIDINKVNNILSSWTNLGNNNIQIILSQTINAGETLWIDYNGIPDNIEIVFPDPLVTIAKLPAIAILIVNSNIKHRFFYSRDYLHLDDFNNEYHISKHPQLTEMTIDIEFMSNNNLESLQMVEDAFNKFDLTNRIKSVGSGEDYIIISLNPLVISDNLKQDVSSKKIRIILSGKKIFNKFTKVKTLENIKLSLGDFNKISDVISIT